MLPADHPRRAEFKALTREEEKHGLYEDTTTIGFRANWERLLASKGLKIENGQLVTIVGDDVRSLTAERNGRSNGGANLPVSHTLHSPTGIRPPAHGLPPESAQRRAATLGHATTDSSTLTA